MRKHSRNFQVALVVAAIVGSGGATSSARAATITGNTTFDPGLIRGVICFPNPCPQQCTLRDAIKAANTNKPVAGRAAGQSITNWNNGPVIIQVFHNSTCDPSGNGEGQKLIHTFTVPSNKTLTFSISRTGGFITATSTPWNRWGSKATSEFSACLGI